MDARIRFMAVAEKYRRLGIGSFILNMLEQYAKSQQQSLIWLNAREQILPFYTLNGYQVTEEVTTTLPVRHFRVEKRLQQPA